MKWNLPNATLEFYPNFLGETEALNYFEHFENFLPWEQLPFTIFGKMVATPRLECYFAENGETYSYSGKKLLIHPFTAELLHLKEKIESISESKFNAVLVNLYRDGNDSNGWHADDEKELGGNPVIASLSLGTTRRFDFKHNTLTEKHSVDLTNGSLLIMKGEMQHYWKHQIAKTKKVHSARINLTFRWIDDGLSTK